MSKLFVNRWFRLTLALVLIVVVGVVFGGALAGNWERVRALETRLDGYWIVALALFTFAVPLSGLLWGRLLLAMGGLRLSLVEAVRVHSLSWTLKYIPGQVGAAGSKLMWATQRGESRLRTAISFVYENVFLQIASIVPSLLILGASIGFAALGTSPFALAFPLVALVPLTLVLHGPTLRRVVNFAARRRTGSSPTDDMILSPRSAGLFTAGYLIPRVLNGLGFVAICASVLPTEQSHWAVFGAAYVLAGAVGILAFFVPSGLGVREAVIVLVLAQFVTPAEAIVVALIARLVATVADAFVFLIYIALRVIPHEKGPQRP